MAQFLNTTGVSYHLEKIIAGASERLVIISPYLRVNDRIKGLLEEKDRLRIDVWVIYGKNELRPEENNWLRSMTSIKTGFLQNLHAKCYMNENEALLTSMNLYEFSQVNNNEMGIIVSRDEDAKLYEDIKDESMRLVRASEIIRVTVDKIEATETAGKPTTTRARREPQQATVKPNNGFCIRCKTDLPAKPTQPYCSRCYASWKRYSNAEYEEKHCHTCGKEHTASMSKPVCIVCFRKYKNVLEFAAG